MAGLPPKLTALLNKGLDLHKSGDLDGALAAYNSVLKKKPQNADALWLKGAAMIGKGEASGAVPVLERAAKRRPDDAEILNDLGMAYEAASDVDSARDAFLKALKLNDSLPSAMINVARYAIKEGDPSRALEMTDRALKIIPHLVEGHNTRGLAYRALGENDQALKSFAAALAIKSDDTTVLFNKGDILRFISDIEGARITLMRAQDIAEAGSADWVKATMTLGLIAAKTGDVDGALQHYDSALSYDPSHIESLTNRGELKQSLGDFDGAVADYDTALALDPEQPSAIYNKSRLNLLQGQWAEGWIGYEARWQIDDFEFEPHDRGLPLWDGTDVGDGTVLLWGEQGLGDHVQFASQIGDVISRGIEPVLEIDPRLVPLFERNFGCPVFAFGEVPFDTVSTVKAQCALGSLGRFLRQSEDAFQPPRAYLRPEQDQVATLRKKYLEKAAGRPIVGVAWTSMNPTYGSEKSLPLQNWSSLLDKFDAFYVSLQYGNVRPEIEAASAPVWIDDTVDQMVDIEAAVAQIGAVDLVISISNTAVHLAGAQGVPTWVIVPAIPEWRWGIDRKHSPWYPDVSIYRQSSPGDWQSALDSVRHDLMQRYSD